MTMRRTRNYKEKRPMATFGQFILPLTVIMAIALLFFSVKLFFFNPNDITPPKEDPLASEQKAQIDVAPKPAKKTAKATVNTVAAHPVEYTKTQAAAVEPVKTKPVVKEPVKTQTVVKEPVKTQPAVNEPVKTVPNVKEPQKTAGIRWDVQIGGFASKDNALQLLKNASAKGHDVYISESDFDEKPFYRVRVKGEKSREDTQKLSAKLQEEGFPVFVVEIK